MFKIQGWYNYPEFFKDFLESAIGFGSTSIFSFLWLFLLEQKLEVGFKLNHSNRLKRDRYFILKKVLLFDKVFHFIIPLELPWIGTFFCISLFNITILNRNNYPEYCNKYWRCLSIEGQKLFEMRKVLGFKSTLKAMVSRYTFWINDL